MALGKSDFGLYGLIGGLVALIGVFNTMLASAVGRFFGVAIGRANSETASSAVASGESCEDSLRADNCVGGLEDCQRWFNVALALHVLIPLILVAIGFPIGLWAIGKYIAIPEGRAEAASWIWCCTCTSCLVGMMTVPFRAMFTAKQEIAEVTVFEFCSTTCNAVFLFYVVTHPGYWLEKYAAWTAFIVSLPNLCVAVRAFMKYDECKVYLSYMWDVRRILGLFKYAAARFCSDFPSMFALQGLAVLVNRHMGTSFNASMTIGNQVAAQSATLASSLSGAFWPVIANKCGEGDMDEVRRYSNIASRMGAMLVLVFALPLSLEINEVLKLWLVTPPVFCAPIAMAVMLRVCVLKITDGYWMAILGSGRGVMIYCWLFGCADLSLLLIAMVVFACGFGMWSVVCGYAFSSIIVLLARIMCGRVFVQMSVKGWLIDVMIPLSAVSIASLAVGAISRLSFDASLGRVLLSTVFCEAMFVSLCWKYVLKTEERAILARKVSGLTCFLGLTKRLA